MRALFTLTIFVNSALLFIVEPMIAKYLLPNFGGSPLVWNVAMVFFQATLLLGYLYAHAATKKLSVGVLLILHLLLLGSGVAVGWAVLRAHPTFNGPPTLQLLAMLAATVGLVFLGLAAGSSLIQQLFSRTSDPLAGDPYFLYSASNIGSLLALLAYPVLLEPNFTLTQQGRLFSIGVGVLLVLLTACGIKTSRTQQRRNEAEETGTNPITNRQRTAWLALTAAPSALLLGVTVYLTTDISPIPLLWVIPLSLYLLTFAIVFARKPLFSARLVLFLMPLAVIPALIAYGFELYSVSIFLMPLHLVALFFLALACHQQVALRRPGTKYLTEYFLWIGVGGVLGGLFSAILAPIIFTDLYEFPVAMIACAFFVALSLGFRRWTAWDLAIPLAMALAIVLLRVPMWAMQERVFGLYTYTFWFAAAAVGLLLSAFKPMRFAVAVLAVIGAILISNPYLQKPVLYASRNFYGSRQVSKDQSFHFLYNGTTLHGVEQMSDERDKPLSYYSSHSGVGKVLNAFNRTPRFQKIAFVGLGAGTLASYGRTGQSVDFYELDPTVEKIARNSRLFLYLTDCKANLRVILGDARLQLRNAPSGHYGLLALDAFTSDAIPVHLLTREAIDEYMRVLRPDGILAVHISNSYVDLEPVVAAAATEHQLVAHEYVHFTTQEQDNEGLSTSQWIVLAHSDKDLLPVCAEKFWTRVKPEPGFRPWTDEYSNLLAVMYFVRHMQGKG